MVKIESLHSGLTALYSAGMTHVINVTEAHPPTHPDPHSNPKHSLLTTMGLREPKGFFAMKTEH
jgi:hypothetical protein